MVGRRRGLHDECHSKPARHGQHLRLPGQYVRGALFVGLAARALPEKYKIAAACAEPVGTGIVGAWVGAKLLGPAIGKSVGFLFFSGSFLVSSVPGAVIGAALVWALNKRLGIYAHMVIYFDAGGSVTCVAHES